MTRTDRKGRNIKLLIEAEIVGEQITVEDLYVACDITKSKYYGDPSKGVAGRAEAEDFPNPLELRNVAEHYQLSSLDFLNLLVEFGWGPVIPGILEGFAKGAQVRGISVVEGVPIGGPTVRVSGTRGRYMPYAARYG